MADVDEDELEGVEAGDVVKEYTLGKVRGARGMLPVAADHARRRPRLAAVPACLPAHPNPLPVWLAAEP